MRRGLTPRRIKAARAKLGLTQEKIADLVRREADHHNLTPLRYTISRRRRGQKSPGLLWGPAVVRLVEESERARVEQTLGH